MKCSATPEGPNPCHESQGHFRPDSTAFSATQGLASEHAAGSVQHGARQGDFQPKSYDFSAGEGDKIQIHLPIGSLAIVKSQSTPTYACPEGAHAFRLAPGTRVTIISEASGPRGGDTALLVLLPTGRTAWLWASHLHPA